MMSVRAAKALTHRFIWGVGGEGVGVHKIKLLIVDCQTLKGGGAS